MLKELPSLESLKIGNSVFGMREDSESRIFATKLRSMEVVESDVFLHTFIVKDLINFKLVCVDNNLLP